METSSLDILLRLIDHHRVFDSGNDADITTAFAAGFDIDIELRLSRCAHVIDARRSAGVWLSPDSDLLLHALAGVTSARCRLWGANIP